jgi:hypothetical protein
MEGRGWVLTNTPASLVVGVDSLGVTLRQMGESIRAHL